MAGSVCGLGTFRATSAQEDHYMRLARRARTVTVWTLQSRLKQSTYTHVSDQTIRNRLHEDG